MNAPATRLRRCAIYTRKSSEEGLDQAFNSLDAQREAGEAYIKSQAHEGWVALPTAYDDGGFSGGNLERPALTALLAAIRHGAIDTVIVYKVDRLSRSLADFVRLVELFDQHGVSFVSVTQQFNTSTSMGRLTLNVLLSFAQFEREVTSERIRDKIAASKQKGLWMGGLVPLGYERIEKQLIVNEVEADLVRHLFARYLELRCVRALKQELDSAGHRSKSRPEGTKNPGGKLFSRGALYTILKNPAYIGKVHHQGTLHEERHVAILEPARWNAVQQTLARNRYDKQARVSVKYPSLLAGLVVDDRGNRMSPTYTRRRNRHYPYYVSQALLQYRNDDAGSVVRIAGTQLDDMVIGQLLTVLRDPVRIREALVAVDSDATTVSRLTKAAAVACEQWPGLSVPERIQRVQRWITRVEVGRQRVGIALNCRHLASDLLGRNGKESHVGRPPQPDLLLQVPVRLKRSGIETKLVLAAGPPPLAHGRTILALQEALAKALRWNHELLDGTVASLAELTTRDALDPRYTSRVLKLAFLAPDIIEAIVAGDVPETLSLEILKKDIPLDWAAQRRKYGFDTTRATHTGPAHTRKEKTARVA